MACTTKIDPTVKGPEGPFYIDRDTLAAVKYLLSTRERAGSEEIKYGVTKVACNAIDISMGRHAGNWPVGRLHLSLFVHGTSILYRKAYYDENGVQVKLLAWSIGYNSGVVTFGEHP